jgi:hypothetical protein
MEDISMSSSIPIEEAIDWEKAASLLPTLKSVQDRHSALAKVSDFLGPGSFLCPPGYPQHYVQSIDDWMVRMSGTRVEGHFYALYHPSSKVWYVILAEQFRAIWKPLPEDHPAIQEWEREVYTYFHRCYSHDGETLNASQAIIWPLDTTFIINKVNIPPRGSSLHGRFNNSARQEALEEIKAQLERMHADDWQETILQYRRQFWEEHQHLLVPENYYAVRYIRTYYPDHQPRLDWFKVAEAPPQ